MVSSSICFSCASILRCGVFPTAEGVALVVPVVLQAILTSALAIILAARSRRQWFLACEGWMELILALLDLFSQLYPAARQDLYVFRALDISIGSMSFLPILLYSFFLYSLTATDLTHAFPPYVRRAIRLCLIFFVPVLVGLHETASFIGISYELSLNGQPAILFQNERGRDLWTFFASATLVLFTVVQVTVSGFATLRIVQTVFEKRRPEYHFGGTKPKLRGICWIDAGIKLGVAETVIGFATGSFGTIFARRMLRFVSRAFFCIGFMVGLDAPSADADSVLSAEKPIVTPYRHSKLKPFISNPRLSTFEQLSPTATTFRQKPRDSSKLVPSPRGPRAPGMNQFAPSRDESNGHFREQRVTVLYTQGLPKLDVRFSGAELPYPAQVATPVDSPISSILRTFPGIPYMPAPVYSTSPLREREYPTLPNPYDRADTGFPDLGERAYSPLPEDIPRPFARQSTGRTESMSSLGQAEIVSVQRTLFAPETAKATVIRTPSGRTMNPSRQNSTESYESLGTKETKGKRIMSGERNEEFYQMLMSMRLRTPLTPQELQAAENVDALTDPGTQTTVSVVISSETSQTGERSYLSRLSSYSTTSNQRGSCLYPQAVADFSSPDWLSMSSSPDILSRQTTMSMTTSERVHQSKLQSVPSFEAVPSQSFLNFDYSRSPTEEYYPKLFMSSQEQLSRKQSQQNSQRSSVSATYWRGGSIRSNVRQPSLLAQASLWLNRKGNASDSTLPPTRPPRNPNRTSNVLPTPVSPAPPTPSAAPARFSQPLAIATEAAQRQHGISTQVVAVQDSTPGSPTEDEIRTRVSQVDSESQYSMSTQTDYVSHGAYEGDGQTCWEMVTPVAEHGLRIY